jgi:hypothetical protein
MVHCMRSSAPTELNLLFSAGYGTEALTGVVYTAMRIATLHTSGWLSLTPRLETSRYTTRTKQLS